MGEMTRGKSDQMGAKEGGIRKSHSKIVRVLTKACGSKFDKVDCQSVQQHQQIPTACTLCGRAQPATLQVGSCE